LYKIKGEVIRASVQEPGRLVARITVHMGTCGISSGADKVYQSLEAELALSGRTDIVLTSSGCAGLCNREPLITIERLGEEAIKYAEVTLEMAREIFRRHVLDGRILTEWAFGRGWEQPEIVFDGSPSPGADGVASIKNNPFFGSQHLWVMRNRGLIHAESLDEYIATDGYQALAKALFQMTPREIIQEIKLSGLRGRGGAGFPTGLKWEFAAASKGEVKYMLCNADEGDPGAFMDRCVLESDPHAVIEGMIIGARAIGAHQGYIYCRAEYPLAVKMLNLAIGKAREYGLLGRDILGSGFAFDLEVYRGAGAFVCGEETALMTSIEGKRGTPRPRPPFPAVQGLYRKPTVLNNVETLAGVPQIILRGGRTYSKIGVLRSKGTKVFALTGDVKNVGLVEVPMGIPLGSIIYDIGGGIPSGKKFKAVQLGGPSGGCVPAQHLNAPVEYESIVKLGAIMGSGGMIVMDEDKCMVDVARFFMDFCVDESCGKCTPCRVGTRQMLRILTDICEGRGKEGDIERLEKWAAIIQNTALCGLGQTAPNPVLSTLRYFRHEYEAHIRDRRCPAVVCASLFKAPCQHACPAGMDVPSYLALTAAGRLEDAYQVLLRTNPFPSVCGRVCDHPCELKCRRATLDAPVNIRYVKRFITDRAPRPKVKPVPISRLEKIAVVGAGPSGLTVARDLALRGYQVTVFEELPEPGGMLRYGIPAYRLPREVIKAEIEAILALGVELRCNTRIGAGSPWQRLQSGYDAVYLAVGAHRSSRLGIEGENLQGVTGAIEFLRQVNLGYQPYVGKDVVVIGGGNSAIDAARSAKRLLAKNVTILYRRLREDMPAQEEEIRAAEEEGVLFESLVTPVRLAGRDGWVEAVVCQRMSLGEFDSSGRRKPLPIPGREFTQRTDQVISAIGQRPDLRFLGLDAGEKITLTPGGLIQVLADSRTRTGQSMIFAGGDVVYGPATVIKAVAAGRRAAEDIDAALRTRNGEPPWEGLPEVDLGIPMVVAEEVKETPRSSMPECPVQDRLRDFREVELGFSEETAVTEAGRCLRCDIQVGGE
ncbi:MAG: NADH-ubiquinone oxidoreductase-F iron-sulfur binding region domain-containing protein, partial [Thermodesulfobacteriota bacterium]